MLWSKFEILNVKKIDFVFIHAKRVWRPQQIRRQVAAPQVQSSILRLSKVDSAFRPLSESIKMKTACLGTEHWGGAWARLTMTYMHGTSDPMVEKAESWALQALVLPGLLFNQFSFLILGYHQDQCIKLVLNIYIGIF